MLPKRAASVVVLLPLVLFAQTNLQVPGPRGALGTSHPRSDEQIGTTFSSRGGKAEKTRAIADGSGGKPVSAQAAFVENKGQWDARVRFQLKSGGKTLWLTDTGIVFDNVRAIAEQNKANEHILAPVPPIPPSLPSHAAGDSQSRLIFCEDFIGANATPTVEPIDVQSGAYNYMIGSDPKGWHTGVRGYASVVYRNIWEGIDIRLTRNGADIEQEFLVHPRADLARVQIAYRGIDRLETAEDGSLEISTAVGKLRETPPRIYQEIAGRRVKVQGRFKLLGTASYAFEAASHNSEYAMIVDPTLLYSTFLGGSGGNEAASGIAVDASGNAYVTGYTSSTDFPTTTGAYQTSKGAGQAAFVTKLNPTGSMPVYSTYFDGPTGGAYPSSIAVDAQGNAYIAGWSASTGFPTTSNAYPQTCSLSVFLTELNSSGSDLIYSSCFGYIAGGNQPIVNSMAMDGRGRVFITGYTSTANIPTTPSAYQTSYPGVRTSAFAMVVDTTSSGSASLLYSTYFGIPSNNGSAFGTFTYGIAVDPYGNFYIAGYAGDSLPVTPGAYQSSLATGVQCNPFGAVEWTCPDGFVAKLNPSVSGAQSLIYSTYLGGPGSDLISAITVDGSGNAYLTGYTDSTGFPVTHGAFQTSVNIPNGGNAFVAFVTKLNAGGSSPIYSTYLAGTDSHASYAYALAVDVLGDAYVAGVTNSATFPVTSDAFQSALHPGGGYGNDTFLTKLNPSGSTPIYSSYLGGTGDEVAYAVAVDQTGDAYVGGQTASGDFPVTLGAFQPGIHGTGDAFVTKFPLGASQTLSISLMSPSSGGNVGTVTGRILGAGFHIGASVMLTGPTTVTATSSVGTEGRTIDVAFDLTGAPAGSYGLSVVNPGGASIALPGAFTVQQGGAPQLGVSVVLPSHLAVDRGPTVLTVQVQNTGNVDAYEVVLALYGIPSDAILKPLFTIAPLPSTLGGLTVDFSGVPFAPVVGQEQIPSLLLSRIPAGSAIALSFSLAFGTVPSPPPLTPLPPGSPALGQGNLNIVAVAALFNTDCESQGVPCLLDILTGLGEVVKTIPGLGNVISLYSCIQDLRCAKRFVDVTTPQGVFNLNQALLKAILDCSGVVTVPGPGTLLKLATIGVEIVNAILDCTSLWQEATGQANAGVPYDPNDKEGLMGVTPSHWVQPQSLLYGVYFSNEVAAAAAAAAKVLVTDPIDPSIDLSTLNLRGLTAAGNVIPVPASFSPALGHDQASTTIDLRPTQSLLISADISLDPVSRVLALQLTSIDPTTGLPPSDPSLGVLPPGTEGSVVYTAKPIQTARTGTQISNQATIVFDTNAPMTTQSWVNTIDKTSPKSQVTALPTTESAATFNVQWLGADQGSGIQGYTIYVSDNGGSFTTFQTNTAATSASYSGQANHSYGFYSIAQDLVGNIEGAKTAAEATTQVAPFSVAAAPITLTIAAPGGTANATVAIPPNPGFSGTVDLTCSVSYNDQGTANAPPTCQLGASQSSITAPTSGSTTLKVSTTAAPQARTSHHRRGVLACSLSSLGFALVLPFTGVLRRRVRLRAVLFTMMVLASLAFMPACGGGGGSVGSGGVPGTTVGNYTITITAAGGGYSTNVSVPLAVQ